MPKRGLEYIESATKRRFDLAAALGIAGVVSPVAAAVGLEAMVEHRQWSPFFSQERVGRNNKPIKVHKFENLHRTNGQPLPELYSGSYHPNASFVGNLIRKAGLDEIPQLYSVIKGDLSMNGIRPLPQAYLDHFKSFIRPALWDEWKGWYDLNQGLTGAGQLMMKQFPTQDEALTERRMELEVKACETASLRHDIQIVMATPFTLLHNFVQAPPILIEAPEHV